MVEKLFKIRVQMHYTNSHSYIAECIDAYVVAENKESAHRQATIYFNNKCRENKEHKTTGSIVFCEELKNFIPTLGESSTRKVLFETFPLLVHLKLCAPIWRLL